MGKQIEETQMLYLTHIKDIRDKKTQNTQILRLEKMSKVSSSCFREMATFKHYQKLNLYTFWKALCIY